jgi:hypothetical protein
MLTVKKMSGKHLTLAMLSMLTRMGMRIMKERNANAGRHDGSGSYITKRPHKS